MTNTAADLFAERNQRMLDVFALRQPDRVPIALPFGYMLARLGGITNQEIEADFELQHQLLEKWSLYYQPDASSGVGPLFPQPCLALGDRQTRWPGYGVAPNASFQFVEGEYMKGEDYDAFLNDPTDYTLRTYLPRAFANLEGLALLPRLPIQLLGYIEVLNWAVLTAPPVRAAFEALFKAADESARILGAVVSSLQRMAAAGFPTALPAATIVEAPFDFMSDTLRGMRGIMLDIYRRPQKLLAAQDKILPMLIESGLAGVRQSGMPFVFIPLHRGSDGFMSTDQFERFYWPQLKALVNGLVDGGAIPFIFWEGVYDERLQYLCELPKGKTVGWFQSSDLFKVKAMVGDTIAIYGGFPVSMLQAGTPQQVRDLTQRYCEVVGRDGGFVMGPNTVMDECNPELVKVWVDATREYGAY